MKKHPFLKGWTDRAVTMTIVLVLSSIFITVAITGQRLNSWLPQSYAAYKMSAMHKNAGLRLSETNATLAMEYISKFDPPPGFEKWLKFARGNQCHLGSYNRIERDLEAFRDSASGKLRILRHHIEGAKRLQNTAVFLIRNGKLNISGADVEGLLLQEKIASLLSRFVKDLPDMEFVVNVNDQPRVLPGDSPDRDERLASSLCVNASESFIKHRLLHGYVNNRQTGPKYEATSELIALFSQAKISECHRDIMYPSVYTIDNRMGPGEDAQLKSWHKRDQVLFFRGSSTGGNFSNMSTFALSHRQRLVEFARNKPEMSIHFTNIIQCEPDVCKAMQKKYGMKKRVTEMQNFDHKYLISIDGNSFAARLSRYLASASLIFRAGMFDEWYEEWLQDGVHYVRVALDYSDLSEKLKWAKENDAQAKKIALQSRFFATNHLRREDMECYWYRLLLEYANILDL